MKKRNLLLLVVSAFVYVSLTAYSRGGKVLSDENGSGARDGHAGCNCHGPQESPDIGISIVLDSAGIPLSSYVPGHSYTIKISGKNNSTRRLPGFGFRMAVVKSKGAASSEATNAGIVPGAQLSADCKATMIGALNIIEHKNEIKGRGDGGGGHGTEYEQSIPWTAPPAGTGDVKIFGVLLASNDNKSVKGDSWNKISATFHEGEAGIDITGDKMVCLGQRGTLHASKEGGTWVSNDPEIVSISSSGAVYGNAQGITTITYSVNSKKSITQVTVGVAPVVAPIEGNQYVCTGTKIALKEKAAGGNWSVNNDAIAFVSATGEVIGVAEGLAEVTYKLTNTCGSDKKVKSINVYRTPDAGDIMAAKTDICVDESVTLTNSVTGGIWTGSSDIAAVGANGVVKAVKEGMVTIFYTLRKNNCAGVAEKTLNFHPNPPDGAVSGPPEIRVGDHRTFIARSPGGFWAIDYKFGSGNASVTSNGEVYGLKEGETGIIYSVQSGACWNVVKRKVRVVNP